MKLYTSKEQTELLVEIGFPKPVGIGYNYSIGELIEFLPKRVGDAQIDFFAGVGKWFVRYEDRHEVPPTTVKHWHSRELIDALFLLV